jgi:hypothetical protein
MEAGRQSAGGAFCVRESEFGTKALLQVADASCLPGTNYDSYAMDCTDVPRAYHAPRR